MPGIRVFLIDDLRNGGDESKFHGVNEVRLRQGRIVREGLQATLSELRLRKDWPSSRRRWLSLFKVHWRNPKIEDAFFTFSLAPDGSIASLTMAPVSPLADFSFDYQDLNFTPIKLAEPK